MATRKTVVQYGDLHADESGMGAIDMAPVRRPFALGQPQHRPSTSRPNVTGRMPFGVDKEGMSNGDLVTQELADALVKQGGWTLALNGMGEVIVVAESADWFKVDTSGMVDTREQHALEQMDALDRAAAEALEAERSWESRRLDELETMTRTPVNAHLYCRSSWDPLWFMKEAKDDGLGEGHRGDDRQGIGTADPEVREQHEVQGLDSGD
jgi:hypothetical protein